MLYGIRDFTNAPAYFVGADPFRAKLGFNGSAASKSAAT
jgi:hypothetical protein